MTIMSPDTPLFGRITLGANRISLGRAGTTTLFVRALEQIRKLRPSDDAVIQLEMSRSPLPDATTFDKLARAEHQLAERIVTDPDQPSPFPGITVGRVAEVMSTREYEAYNELCEPDKRMGLSQDEINAVYSAYWNVAADCIAHFPKWID